MSSSAGLEAIPRARPVLRPLALPVEHGGWGFLLEPIALGLAVAASAGGALVACAFVFAFLARQPLRLALQDLVRRRTYPRTGWCWLFASAYGLAAGVSLAAAVATAGWTIALPLAAAAPLGLVQIAYDARNRSRGLFPELAGAAPHTSSAAAIGLAGALPLLPALSLSAILAARAVPSIVYVRTLLRRAHGQTASSAPALVLHLLAITGVALLGSLPAVMAMALLLLRAAWQLRRPIPPAKKIGWREIAFGAVTVVVVAIGW